VSKPSPSPLTTLYRLTIMMGALACGSLAAYRYGPEPAELAAFINRTAERLGVATQSPSAAPEPELFVADEASPADTSAPRFDAAVRPASDLQPIERDTPNPPTLQDVAQSERLVAPVIAAGASRAEVTPWGRGTPRVFRATAAMPVGEAATGLERRFDAVGETPEAAVAALVDAVRGEAYRR